MKKGLRSISVVVALALSVSMLAGCGSNSKTNDPSAVTQSGLAEQSTQTNQELKPYEMVFAFPGTEQKDLQVVQDEMNKILTEKINATVKLMPISFSVWTQQTNLMLAGNEKLDLMFTSSFFNYNSIVSMGQVVPLEDLLQKEGQDITKAFEPNVLNSSKINGHIYALPSIRDFAANYGMVMRKDIVDKYKINVNNIKSPNDITPVLKTVKDNEPNMTPIVLTGESNTFVETLTSGDFDRLDNGLGVLSLTDDNMKVVNYYETPEYSNMLKLIREWYLAGYISKDAATSKETGTDQIKANKAFSLVEGMKPGNDLQRSKATGTEMVSASLTKPISTTSNITNVMTSITKNCQDKDRAMMFLNLMYSNKDLENLFDNGIVEKHYVIKSGDVIDFPAGINSSTTGYQSNNWEAGNNFLSHIWNGDDPQLWTKMAQFNKESVKSKALGFTFSVDKVKTEMATINNIKSQYRMGLETGTLDPAKVLPEFISKLKSAGIDQIIAEKQRQLDEWAKSNK